MGSSDFVIYDLSCEVIRRRLEYVRPVQGHVVITGAHLDILGSRDQ